MSVEVFLRAALVDNLALSFFLGMCMFLASSRRMETALGMGAAVLLVMSVSVPLNQILYARLLRPGAWEWAGLDADLSFLKLITFIAIIAALVQIVEMAIERYLPVLRGGLGIYLPMVTVNCAILGAGLFMVERDLSLAESVAFGAGSGVGWAAAIIVLAGIRDRLRYSDAPEGLRGTGLAFVAVGWMSLGFLAFAAMGG